MPVDTFIADVGVYPSVGDAETDTAEIERDARAAGADQA
jgi:hypothetical protein